jgi:hypothetical protein
MTTEPDSQPEAQQPQAQLSGETETVEKGATLQNSSLTAS